ncbi:hypothetical protein ACFWNL_04350 [Kitasatospora sp. NPDC058397]|uniref:hypothetical protein n=1 Tax=unclassified Kitasatospora TaxID=2633591 RepID=UPI00364E5646
MNNLNFSAEPLFSWYVVALAISGAAMLVLGAVNPGSGLKVGWRILNVLAGLGFLGYAYYLAFVFEGEEYRIFLKAFILPIALIASSVKAIVERGNAKNQQPAPQAAPYDQPVPPQGAPYAPPAQPVPDNPYAQPVPPAGQSGQAQ